ncbi:hypothetical protein LUZ60_015160 [Juncus effusus]|nr:hypothetical protein LUZ60_015160 [Juncus effusus]
MEETKSKASLRWKILRRSLLPRFGEECNGNSAEEGIRNISRKAATGFNLIKCQILDDNLSKLEEKDICICYKFPFGNIPDLHLTQRREDTNTIGLDEFEVSKKYNIDTTGLVCSWPSEDVLAYYCINHPDKFRFKRVLELGSGYGLAGFAIGLCTNANEVLISDGNPQVVDYIQQNVEINGEKFGDTKLKSVMIHWDQEISSELQNSFDIIVASDCTFFKEFHESLACIIKIMLRKSENSEAIFIGPKRGDSLEKFIERIKGIGLNYELIEKYDDYIWTLHGKFNGGNDVSWSNYDSDHCYPLLLRIYFARLE